MKVSSKIVEKLEFQQTTPRRVAFCYNCVIISIQIMINTLFLFCASKIAIFRPLVSSVVLQPYLSQTSQKPGEQICSSKVQSN